jgi:hypothetical protein
MFVWLFFIIKNLNYNIFKLCIFKKLRSCEFVEVLSLHKIWSPNRKKYWVRKSQIHKCHTCGRFANLTNFVSPQICGFAELICGPLSAVNFPPVLLIPVQVCHRCSRHRWQISHLCCTSGVLWLASIPKHNFLKKFEMTLNLIFRGLEKEDSWKKPEAKNLVTLSL